MNQPHRGFQEKTQDVPLPFFIRALARDTGNKGVFVDFPGQRCIHMNKGRP